MEFHERELLVARVASGAVRLRLGGGPVLARAPSREVRYLAQEVYDETFRDAELGDLFTDAELLEWMRRKFLWTDADRQEVDQLERDVDEFKVKMFQCGFKRNERAIARRALDAARRRLGELYGKRHAYDHCTCHGAAAGARARFLLACSLADPAGEPLFTPEGVWDDPSPVLDEAMEAYFKVRLTEPQYRELARTEPWRSLWASRKGEGAVFGVPGVDLTEEQRTLLVWSQMYDNVAEHSDAPPDEVVKDDDLLDGWLISQRRLRLRAEKEKKGDLITNEHIRNAQEVFVVVDTPEDAAEVESLNDPVAAAAKRQRLARLAEAGRVEEADMPDTKMELQMQANRAQQVKP